MKTAFAPLADALSVLLLTILWAVIGGMFVSALLLLTLTIWG